MARRKRQADIVSEPVAAWLAKLGYSPIVSMIWRRSDPTHPYLRAGHVDSAEDANVECQTGEDLACMIYRINTSGYPAAARPEDMPFIERNWGELVRCAKIAARTRLRAEN